MDHFQIIDCKPQLDHKKVAIACITACHSSGVFHNLQQRDCIFRFYCVFFELSVRIDILTIGVTMKFTFCIMTEMRERY